MISKTLKYLGPIAFLFALHAQADESLPPHPKVETGESFTVYIDNDSRNIGGPNEDQGYTNGIRFSYIYGENKIPDWIHLFPWSSRIQKKFDDANSNYGISIAQQIYTPNDTAKTELISNDRPYAGYLYVGLSAAYKTASHQHLLEADFGVVGPEAMGEQVQNNFHDIIKAPRANGWENQIHTEPTIQLSYTQKLRFIEKFTVANSRYLDFIPQFGVSLGNVLIAAHTGAMLRFGLHLPNDFGPGSFSNAGGSATTDLKLDPKKFNWRLYGFAGIQGRVVAHNIFLDGNTFRPSHHVTKYPFVAETQIGYALQISRFVYSWRFVTLSPEFEQYSEVDSYASMALTYLKDF